MADTRRILERELRRVNVRPFTLDSFTDRRLRRRRNERIAAGLVGAAVAIGIAVVAIRAGSGISQDSDVGSPGYSWIRFESPSYGYSLDHPQGWQVDLPLLRWTDGWLTSALFDRLVDPNDPGRIVLEAASIRIPDGMSPEQWQDQEQFRYRHLEPSRCKGEARQVAPTIVDGVRGRLVDCRLILVASDGRGYVFRLRNDISVDLE